MASLNELFVGARSSNITRLKRGGLRHLERFLGLQLENALFKDAVFVSLDLEVGSDRQRLHLSTDEPLVTQLGFARLDMRDFDSLVASNDWESLISAYMYQIEVLSKSKKAARKPEQPYLKVLRLLGIDISTMAPIAAVLDTHTLSRFVLPPHHPNAPRLPGQDFSLRGVLARLGCRPPIAAFHNAGNDAVFSLLAVLLLTVRSSAARKAELGASELVNLHAIERAVSRIQTHYALAGTGAQHRDLDPRPPATLGAGLRELGLLYPFGC
ncbi:hypothetical protein F4802DRAFT_618369 [Xylaria palmicola]|nr:hypothetical protein F4802DRAFT_618369 [Xylaria palmicola]